MCARCPVAATQCSKNIILQSNNTEANTTLHLDDIYTDMGDMGFGKRSKCLKMKLWYCKKVRKVQTGTERYKTVQNGTIQVSVYLLSYLVIV